MRRLWLFFLGSFSLHLLEDFPDQLFKVSVHLAKGVHALLGGDGVVSWLFIYSHASYLHLSLLLLDSGLLDVAFVALCLFSLVAKIGLLEKVSVPDLALKGFVHPCEHLSGQGVGLGVILA